MKDEDLFKEFNLEQSKQEKERKIKFEFEFSDFKSVLYTGLFYLFGLFLGSYFYKITQFENIDKLLAPSSNDFLELFIANFCVYFSIFVLVVFLGFCLIGFPVVNAVPMTVGIFTGIKLAYYFVNYGVKGVGYSLIMIVPFSALFVTVIALTIEISTNLSQNIMDCTKNADSSENNIDIKDYTKKYLIYAVLILAVSAVNSVMTCLLYSVVTI